MSDGPDLLNVHAIWSELPHGVKAWAKETLLREGLAVGDWPESPTWRRVFIYAAASVRAERLERVEGLSRTAALERCADEFGVTPASLRRMFWRVHRQVDKAVETDAA